MAGLAANLRTDAGTDYVRRMCSNPNGCIRYFIVETIRRTSQHVIQSAVASYAFIVALAVTRNAGNARGAAVPVGAMAIRTVPAD